MAAPLLIGPEGADRKGLVASMGGIVQLDGDSRLYFVFGLDHMHLPPSGFTDNRDAIFYIDIARLGADFMIAIVMEAWKSATMLHINLEQDASPGHQRVRQVQILREF